MTWNDVVPLSVEYFTDLINNRTRFAFSRWGDGEWRSALRCNKISINCDGHMYYPTMGQALQKVLISRPDYYLGMQPMSMRMYSGLITTFLQKHALTDLKWCDSDIFHWAITHDDRHDAFKQFLSALRQRPVVVVGPWHMRSALKPLLNYCAFVEVPKKNCYLSLEKIQTEVLATLAKIKEPAVVSLSCGMPAEILLDHVYRAPDNIHTVIDMGAVWDGYCNVASRSYLKTLLPRGWKPPQ